MNKRALLILALAAVFLLAAVGYAFLGGHGGESEPLLNGGGKPEQSDETKPDDSGVVDVEIWEGEEPTAGGEENSGSGDQTQNNGGNQSGQSGNQSGGQGGAQNGQSGNQSGGQGGTQNGQGAGSQGNSGSGSQGNQSGGDQGGDETTPVEPDPTEPNQPQQPTEPAPGTDPTEPEEKVLTYAEYLAMPPEKQQAFYESFPSLQAFMDWYNAAKAAYEENKDGIIVEDGNIDIGDYIEKP